MSDVTFPPNRTAALERLRAFLPHAGRDYTARRNYDVPGHGAVSRLSPYLRHRVLTETEVLGAVLERWSPSTADKFVQEVVWRSYFKGWLERRPGIWTAYRQGVAVSWNRVQTEGGLRRDWEAACRGDTGIDAFDHWAQELVRTGYLHNHARMWFASIWVFTLELPWELGADFFLRHLKDGDPASNTLGWRWVAGLHTMGRHYVARAANIAEYTEMRFRPDGLAPDPAPLTGAPHPEPLALRAVEKPDPTLSTGLIVTEDDLSPGFVMEGVKIGSTLIVDGTRDRSPLAVSENVTDFATGLIEDCITQYGSRMGKVSHAKVGKPLNLMDYCRINFHEQIIMPYVPAGPARDRLAPELAALQSAGIRVIEHRREIDSLIWPLATAGFFKVKKKIPEVLTELGLA